MVKWKQKYDTDPHISLTKKTFEDRKIISKLRTSEHLLEIEKGTCTNIKREELMCCHCSLNEIKNGNYSFFYQLIYKMTNKFEMQVVFITKENVTSSITFQVAS